MLITDTTAIMVRRIVHFGGRVQGVGFRYAVVEAVGDDSVRGYVRNLSDGRVEAAFEGELVAIDRVLERVRLRMAGHIDHEAHRDEPATGAETLFEIRR